MSNIYLTPNMNLVIPVPGSEPGPNWASDINSSLTLIDAHNHTSGNGVQITPAGININTTLSMNGNILGSIGSLSFATQSSTPSNLSLYVNSPDLYYVDGNGNNVKITSGGSVNATSSGISSGTASASFTAGVLVVNAASNTPANIQGASLLLGNNVANSKYLTLSPPSSMASNFSLVLPSIPSQTTLLTLDTSGNITAPTNPNISGGLTTGSLTTGAISGSAISCTSLTANSAVIAGVNTFYNSGLVQFLDLQLANTNSGYSNAVIQNTNTTDSLGILRGTVDQSGSVIGGEGFTVGHPSNGVYNITFTNAFADQPVVVASIRNVSTPTGVVIYVNNESTTGCTFTVLGNGGSGSNQAFSFIAIGQY